MVWMRLYQETSARKIRESATFNLPKKYQKKELINKARMIKLPKLIISMTNLWESLT